MKDGSYRDEHKELDPILESLEYFNESYPDMGRDTQMIFVLSAMSAGYGYWTPNDIKAVLDYFSAV